MFVYFQLLGFLGSPLGVLRTFLEVLGVLSGLPCGPSGRSWGCALSLAVFGESLGGPGCRLGVLGESLGRPFGFLKFLGGPWRLLVRPGGGRSAPDVTHSDVSSFHVFL